jgi:protein-tyrosine phosphatase
LRDKMTGEYSRHLNFEEIINFRDIGGYPARNGRTVAWRRVFRSGEFHHMTENDLNRLTGEIGLNSVLDLRSSTEVEGHGIGRLAEADIRYHNVSFIAGADREEDERLFKECNNMGDFYLHIVRHREFGRRIVAALKIIANPANHPLVFHCAVGKDRTGIMAAMLLSVIGVGDVDIIKDYSLSAPYIKELLRKIKNDPEIKKAIKPLPDYFWEADPESMALFLSTMQGKYGSIKDYLYAQGMERSLPQRLEDVLLT